jgi:hypothetical protein
MKLLREYGVQMSSEYEDEIWGPEKKVKFFLAGHHSQRTTKGVVCFVPESHYGPSGPLADIGEYDPSFLVATSSKWYYWEASINDKLEQGDVVWFDTNANRPESHLGDLKIRIRPALIQAYQKQGVGPVLPYGGKYFISRSENKEGIIWKPTPKFKGNEGTVVKAGIPLTGAMTTDIKDGDVVLYDDAYNYLMDLPEIGWVSIVPHTKIIAKNA